MRDDLSCGALFLFVRRVGFVFFFQAEDGIRDLTVTGVQTCALPISCSASSGVAISTNPKPRDRPVSRSVTTLADSTVPAAAKASRRPSLEVENERPPMKSLTAMRRAPFWKDGSQRTDDRT